MLFDQLYTFGDSEEHRPPKECVKLKHEPRNPQVSVPERKFAKVIFIAGSR